MNDNAESIHFYASGYLRTDSTIETDLTSVVPGPSVTGAWIPPSVSVSRIQISFRLRRSYLSERAEVYFIFTFLRPRGMQNSGGGAVSSYHNIVGATSFLYNAFCHRETDKIFALCSSCIINHVMFTSKDYGMLV
ncbi:hypothetical protein SNK05_13708 [Fusarium graminearum]|uniref:Chromosome 2, complete genome n=1 Tax=Gibberella zeae (strain ATCC MYA-4620 / CBS 123657 / FGSC 9075 / NRRL 31084 / PH-1) TaxID=229533 RepID=A0A098DG08_GIBZE|nr:unnamed protein product [Fusarium graminearum]